jgi:UDP-glucose:(heptosyl)LPS alpha-1,3-glucosyltransferase
MKSLRIAFIRQRYVAHGGAERILERLMATLRDDGVKIAMVAREWHGVEGIELHRCRPFHLGRLWRDLAFARCACRTVQQLRVDLVQSHERIACCDIYRAGDGVHRAWLEQRARQLGPVARWWQRFNPYHRHLLAAERRVFESPRLKAVICNSRMVRDEIAHHFRVEARKLHVIYNGVDTSVFHPSLVRHREDQRRRLSLPADAMVFLFVGAGFERKGLSTAIRALSRLPQGYLIVVGTDRRLTRYQRQARALGVDHRLRFVGAQRDVTPYYGMADVFVLPTLYDPFPNAALEAMAAGLPIVTSRRCGAAELVNEGVNGFVCNAQDDEAFAAGMRELGDVTKREARSRAARAAAEGLSLETMSKRLYALYQSLLPAT